MVRIEAEALRALADRLAGPMLPDFERAVELLYGCAGRIVVTGMGKSGLIARKIAATLTSTGSPALFLHPAEALHGDLGMVVRGDVVLALSASGETGEILQLLATVKRLGVPLITMTCDELHSPSGRAAQLCRRWRKPPTSHWTARSPTKPVPLDLRPPPRPRPCSRWAMPLRLRFRNVAASRRRTSPACIPGGKLGKRFLRVSALMHTGDALPRVKSGTALSDVIYEMSRKGLGMTTVVDGDKLVGLISDGDLRRLLEQHGKKVFDLSAAECMTRSPRTVGPDVFAIAALDIMEQKKITSLPVVDAGRSPAGRTAPA